MKPVDDWKQSWRWWSVQANVAAQGVLGGWVFLRDQPLPKWAMALIWVILAAGLIGRLIHQPKKGH